MSPLIGSFAIVFHMGKEFSKGKIVFVGHDSVWIIQDSGFLLVCDPNSIQVPGGLK